jgi:hypothetical protein
MSDDPTNPVVQRFLNELAELRGDAPAESIVRELLAGAVTGLARGAIVAALRGKA